MAAPDNDMIRTALAWLDDVRLVVLEAWAVHGPALWEQLVAAAPYAAAAIALVLLWLGLRHLGSRRGAGQAEGLAQSQLAAEVRAAREQMAGELAELKGRMAAMAENHASRQGELSQALGARLDHVTTRLGEGLQSIGERVGARLADNGNRTHEGLSKLYERLAVIDRAGASLTELTGQVVTLKDILSNKQARGAFGQGRMEAIIQDGLPQGAYEFQATLSNGKRPDCLVRLPSAPAPLVIDAKFPLEGFEALRLARSADVVAAASLRIRQALGAHIDDIASKYLIPGETQDMALMFVPSESVTAELHEHFPDLIQRAHRARVVIVSPSMLMLAVQTMQAVLKDVRMREQAGLVQREVGLLAGDVARLVERVKDLEKHFTLAAKDVEKILTSSGKIGERAARIDAVDLADEARAAAADQPRALAQTG
jgi:DNA recombination protein RmuC